MPTVSILNTDSNIGSKTVMAAENAETVTGLKTFDRDPSAPFAVSAGSAVVSNLDADKVDGYEASQLAVLAEAETVTGAWTFNAGVKFPASQNASADANTIDDYEEGTWTPTITSSGGGTPTYTTQTGSYVKVGQLVFASARVTLATKGTLAAGSLRIEGLPFTNANIGTNLGGVSVGFIGNLATSIASAMVFTQANSTIWHIYYLAAAGGTGANPLTVADVNATFDIMISGCYRATA